jgi:hypothetical protein
MNTNVDSLVDESVKETKTESLKPLTVISAVPHIAEFWHQVSKNWQTIYKALTAGNINDINTTHKLINWFLGDSLFQHIEIEITVNEINRTEYPESYGLIELYVSPRLKKDNVPIMDEIINMSPTLPNLSVIKYRAFNNKDALIADIEYEDHLVKYNDIGCQISMTYDDTRKPLLNVVIYVKKPLANHILEKKKVTFILPDNKETILEKWLPTKTSAIDILLLNIIGEYNVLYNLGYVEFLPEGDPLIAEGSVFTELSDLKGQINIIDKCLGREFCNTCDRQDYQTKLLVCSRCKKTTYCSKICQRLDYKSHKKFCT